MKQDFYIKKLHYSYNEIEVYQYKNPVFCLPRKPKRKKLFKSYKKTNNGNRTRTEVRRLINSNPDLNKFFTLTFAKNLGDLSETNPIFKDFVLRMLYNFPDFRYVAVPEHQKRGAVHYHLLCKLPFVPQKRLQDIWGQGIVHIRKVDTVTNLGLYMSKYLSKQFEDLRYFRKKKFFHSKDLVKPLVFYDDEADGLLSLVTGFETKLKKHWIVPFHGPVDYESLTLDNK